MESALNSKPNEDPVAGNKEVSVIDYQKSFCGLLLLLQVYGINHNPNSLLEEVESKLPTHTETVPTPLYVARTVLAELELRASEIDRLTGLYNQRKWFDIISERKDGFVAFIDLDGFKALNDSLGHDSTDEKVLKPIGNMLIECEEGIMACRRSGDEFIVYIPGSADLRKLRKYLESKFEEINDTLSDSGAKVGATIGIVARNNKDTDEFRKLINEADSLVSENKRSRAKRGRLIEYIIKLLNLPSGRGVPSNGSVNFVPAQGLEGLLSENPPCPNPNPENNPD